MDHCLFLGTFMLLLDSTPSFPVLRILGLLISSFQLDTHIYACTDTRAQPCTFNIHVLKTNTYLPIRRPPIGPSRDLPTFLLAEPPLSACSCLVVSTVRTLDPCFTFYSSHLVYFNANMVKFLTGDHNLFTA
jgi:hypothetical protein